MKMDKREKVIDALWGKLEKLTVDKTADGVDIEFEVEGKTIKMNTKIVGRPRIMSMDSFYRRMEEVALRKFDEA